MENNVISGGRAISTPLYIDNLCRAVDLALSQQVSGGIYNITDDVTVSWREFSETIASHLGVRPRFLNIPAPVALSAGILME